MLSGSPASFRVDVNAWLEGGKVRMSGDHHKQCGHKGSSDMVEGSAKTAWKNFDGGGGPMSFLWSI